ncbi:MAG: hypothetical protein A2X72_14085 [Burkholderiales bacterium GWF1_66_17]|nr:MAG: hypothetical protein A2X73_01095 [Burkholderiales bacterium GWE1_65_30]OGA90946.1 MAG: hypothetical protein A2X72_14085 [Burkholderiales bacterium GWF1_66_17]
MEIERQFLTVIARSLSKLGFIDFLLANLKHKLIVTLVCRVLPVALRRNNHANTVANLTGNHTLDRRSKIGHIQLAVQSFWQRSSQEIYNQILALLADVDTDLVARKINHHPP